MKLTRRSWLNQFALYLRDTWGYVPEKVYPLDRDYIYLLDVVDIDYTVWIRFTRADHASQRKRKLPHSFQIQICPDCAPHEMIANWTCKKGADDPVLETLMWLEEKYKLPASYCAEKEAEDET